MYHERHRSAFALIVKFRCYTPHRITKTVMLEPVLRLRYMRSAMHTWTHYVLDVVQSSDDIKTLSDWAHTAGVSYTSLRELCYVIGVPPSDALSFARALRAYIGHVRHGVPLSALLDIRDRRSLVAFTDRTGLTETFCNINRLDIDAFLRAQQVIPQKHDALIHVRQSLAQLD